MVCGRSSESDQGECLFRVAKTGRRSTEAGAAARPAAYAACERDVASTPRQPLRLFAGESCATEYLHGDSDTLRRYLEVNSPWHSRPISSWLNRLWGAP